MKRGRQQGPGGDAPVFAVQSFSVPTHLAGERVFTAQAECWSNRVLDVLGGRTPWEAWHAGEGRDRVEAWLRERIGRFNPELERYRAVLDLAPPALGRRLIEAYERSGGMLNLFAEPVGEDDDEQWQALVRERLEQAEPADSGARARAEAEVNETWNDMPSELFAMLTPGQVWAGGGEREAELITEFLKEHTEEIGEQGFPSRGEALKASLIFLRRWQLQPRRSSDGRAPGDAIREERQRILERRRLVAGR